MSVSTVLVTAGQVPSQSFSFITVQAITPTATSTVPVENTTADGGSISTLGIVIILLSVLLAIALVVLFVIWRAYKRLKGSRYEQSPISNRQTTYYEMSRPAKTYKSRVSRHQYNDDR